MSGQPQAQAPAQAQQGQGANQQQDGQGGGFLQSLFRMVMFYYLFRSLAQWMTGQNNNNNNNNQNAAAVSGGSNSNTPFSTMPHRNLWPIDTTYNLRVYLSESSEINFSDDLLVWQLNFLKYNSNDETNFEKMLNITLTPTLQENGTMYAHIVLHQLGYPWNSADSDFDESKVVYVIHPVTVYKKLARKKATKLLFGDKNGFNPDDYDMYEENSGDSSKENDNASNNNNNNNKKTVDNDIIVSHWKPEVTIRPLVDWTQYPAQQIPIPIAKHFRIDRLSNGYWPVVYMDDFWLLKDRYIPLNKTVQIVPLKFSHNPIGNWKFMIQTQMEEQQRAQAEWGLSSRSDEESDELRRLLMESNPYLLGLTMVVTLLHSIFDFLAFKNDIQFWKNTQSVEGLSVRSIFLNAVCQLIIFLYLLENNTSWMIIISSGIGCLIEFWKITQSTDVTYGWNGKIPWISIKDKKSYLETPTAKYDKEAMTYLSYVFYPLVIIYSIYSLLYNEHKGWYSFVLSTLVSFIYMFGFIMMCPQLYLNYKLQSVAHLPWRMLTYKFLNTIIDDLFAFLITMPWMHRLSCFRDDLIFLIYLYQKWIYPTDYTRTNEYGYRPKTADEIAGGNDAPKAVNSTESGVNTTKNTEDENENKNENEKEKEKEDLSSDKGLRKRNVKNEKNEQHEETPTESNEIEDTQENKKEK